MFIISCFFLFRWECPLVRFGCFFLAESSVMYLIWFTIFFLNVQAVTVLINVYFFIFFISVIWNYFSSISTIVFILFLYCQIDCLILSIIQIGQNINGIDGFYEFNLALVSGEHFRFLLLFDLIFVGAINLSFLCFILTKDYLIVLKKLCSN